MNCIPKVIDNDLSASCWAVCIKSNSIRFMEVTCTDKVCTIREISDLYI